MAITLTPVLKLPCPDGNELVKEGNDAITSLALAVEAALAPPWVPFTPLGANYSARAGYLVPAYRVLGTGMVQLRGGLTKSSAIVSGETVFTLPAEARPTAAVSVVIAVHRTGATNAVAGKLDIVAATGVVTVHVIDAQAAVSIAIDGGQFSKG
jgi:hypothetical protein